MSAHCLSEGGDTPGPGSCGDQSAATRLGKRSRQSSDSPLGQLLEQIKSLRLPIVDPESANKKLGPYIRQALLHDDAQHTLLALVGQFGWRGDGFTQRVDLFCLSTTLQKYRYERLAELGSGSYAVVYKARNRETDEVIALKKLRFGFDEQGLPSSTLREISLLKELKHENIVELKDIIYGFGTSNVYVVLECMDCDLRDLLDRQPTVPDMASIKSYMWQILKAVHYAHTNCVMHRDLKPQNILVDASGQTLKIADFGLARSFLPPFKAYTDKVVTLWYRAPELLLGAPHYSTAVDIWSVGCIFAELLNYDPLFRAESEIGLLHKIFEALGTPGEGVWAGVERLQHFRASFPQWRPQQLQQIVPLLADDPCGLELLASMLVYDPTKRVTAGQALRHPWFAGMREQDAAKAAAAQAAAAQAAAAQAQQSRPAADPASLAAAQATGVSARQTAVPAGMPPGAQQSQGGQPAGTSRPNVAASGAVHTAAGQTAAPMAFTGAAAPEQAGHVAQTAAGPLKPLGSGMGANGSRNVSVTVAAGGALPARVAGAHVRVPDGRVAAC